ncbi:arogenate dehydratase/prephenate dehydratase 6, chloroplastic [Eucalyptus grandis]|uniref:Uncharacterized protein n=2 Tax=Eucalyptus grandis TaxID=71139 RepID=A0ACC3J3A7_EUCGR|nr:arogenate dehydratase/prephenate dehydratase 6, chloroplastic [Eucalyptus grandis]KAK3408134.1 hypothetical protein EUGRSUZ_J00428 [Eucalyptus grandis]
MQALAPSTPANLRALVRPAPPPSRMARAVRCSFRSDAVYFPNCVGHCRADWQSSCAILSSKVLSLEQPAEKSGGGADHVAAVNGHRAAVDLNLVPIETKDSPAPLVPAPVPSAPAPQQPKPLSISDLSPAPLHGSLLRVAYQGVPGAYSEAAAGKAYPKCEAVPCDQFEAAFQAVELWIADRAVLPVENSLGGSIHRNYDLLLRHRLHIVGEVQMPVHHCILALPGSRLERLSRVISHPQALSQCEHTITRLAPQATREAVDDTAGAAEYIATNRLPDTAAIASARAAELYGLEVLADGVQDDCGNVTRFLMLAREPIIPRTDRPFKTSIVFAHNGGEGTGVLFKVLSAFAFRNISLTKIESRPHRNRPIRLVDDANVGTAKHFEYMFYIDFEASMAEVRAQNALAEVQEYTSFLRVLGSYPMDMTPWSPPPPTSGGDSD